MYKLFYFCLLNIFDLYKHKSIGNQSWYNLYIHVNIEKYLCLNSDRYCKSINKK